MATQYYTTIEQRVNEIVLGDVASEEEKQNVLGEMRRCVDQYKGYVEDRLDVDLSRVEVKDDSELVDDVAGKYHREATSSMYKSAWRHGRLPNAYDKAKANAKSGMIELLKPVGRALRKLRRDPKQQFNANPLTKNIYVPFGFNQEIAEQYGDGRLDNIEADTIHELTHVAWFEKSDMNFLDARRQYGARAQEAWHEGFAAEYCVQHAFDDLVSTSPTNAYEDHLRFMEEVIQREGRNIITDIPNDWTRLHEKTPRPVRTNSQRKQTSSVGLTAALHRMASLGGFKTTLHNEKIPLCRRCPRSGCAGPVSETINEQKSTVVSCGKS